MPKGTGQTFSGDQNISLSKKT